jgi:hypothetical protein
MDKAMGMESCLGGSSMDLETEEARVPLPYLLAQKAWQMQPLSCLKPSKAPQHSFFQYGSRLGAGGVQLFYSLAVCL